MRRAAAILAAALALPATGPSAAGQGCAAPGTGAFVLPGTGCFRMAAVYEAPTDRYPHGILGDPLEWGVLEADQETAVARFVLPERLVFEDIAPRLADVTGDAAPEIIVVESDAERGARLAIYRASFPTWFGEPKLRRIAATAFIGQRFRWLAPVGAADLDGDGQVEIAYVETPHLGKRLRVWRFEAGALREIASLSGVTNHRIGDKVISGGLRDCGDGPEMVLADSDWSRLVAITFDGAVLTVRDSGVLTGPESFATALTCG